jgi:hypothetical protein
LRIAIDVVRGYPDRLARRPERFSTPREKSVGNVKSEPESVLAAALSARKFSYTRGDGSAWALALKDVVDRRYGVRDGLQPERLRRAAVGRAG